MTTKRVLIIDDETDFTRLLKLNLNQTRRFTVQAVNDPLQAVEAARSFSPDLILLDVMMPGMDGGEVAARIQDVPRLKHTPIVFLTAAVRKDEVASRRGYVGGLPFIAKPVELDEVLMCIDNQLHRESSMDVPAG